MRKTRLQHGFTIIELVIVVTIIGILAMLIEPAFRRIQLRARGAALVSELRVFEEAFVRYAQEHGEFPSSQRNRDSIPPGMDGYLSAGRWETPSPVGGYYTWDDAQGGNARRSHNGAIMVRGGTLSMADMRLIDEWFDDNKTNDGLLQVRAAGATVVYIVEK